MQASTTFNSLLTQCTEFCDLAGCVGRTGRVGEPRAGLAQIRSHRIAPTTNQQDIHGQIYPLLLWFVSFLFSPGTLSPHAQPRCFHRRAWLSNVISSLYTHRPFLFVQLQCLFCLFSFVFFASTFTLLLLASLVFNLTHQDTSSGGDRTTSREGSRGGQWRSCK